jgi:pimeloyl-ACP methyl ester carboxylesterase
VEKEGMDSMANTLPYTAPAKGASPLVRSFIRELLLAQDPAGYISNCRVLLNAKPPDYGKIAVPVLIIAGEEDKTATLEGCQKMFDEMQTEKKLEVMKGVGHWQCLESFEEVLKLIRVFYHDIQ